MSAPTLVRWDVKAFELLLAAVIKNNPDIKLKPDDVAKYYDGHSVKAISHRLTMAMNVAEAMTVGGDNDEVLEDARAVMNGHKRKHTSDIGGDGAGKAKRAKADRKTIP